MSGGIAEFLGLTFEILIDIMKLLILIPLLVPFVIAPALAQKTESFKHLRIIAMGELPPWDEKLVDGIRQGQPFKPGEVPPAEVSIKRTDQEPLVKPLRLRQISDFFSAPIGDTGVLNLFEGKKPGGDPWLVAPLKGDSNLHLALIFPDHENMSWNQTQSLVIPDDLQALPLGEVRFTNVSHKPIVVTIRVEVAEEVKTTKRFTVAPGKTHNFKREEGAIYSHIAYIDDSGRLDLIDYNRLKMSESDRIQCVFYKSKGKKAVRMTKIHEGAPTPPRKKKAAPAPVAAE